MTQRPLRSQLLSRSADLRMQLLSHLLLPMSDSDEYTQLLLQLVDGGCQRRLALYIDFMQAAAAAAASGSNSETSRDRNRSAAERCTQLMHYYSIH
jgi:hypothetical protein